MEITVKASSRLHFGIIDMRGDLGRIHGSVGIAIKQPQLVIKVKKANEVIVKGKNQEKIQEYACKILQELNIDTGVEVNLIQTIPEHSGFGSGTQLALSIGTAVTRLYDKNLQIEEVALILERSRISGIGTHAFKNGGFIVDGGHATKNLESIPPLIFNKEVPRDWVFVIGLPEIEKGFSGEREKKAFKKLEPPPVKIINEVSRLVLLQMIPSIIEKDIEKFGDSMTKLDSKFGDYWLKVQGGRYSHRIIEKGINHLLNNGAYGAGQSSWGPAFYGLANGINHAEELTNSLRSFMKQDNIKGEVFYTHANNSGALFTIDQ